MGVSNETKHEQNRKKTSVFQACFREIVSLGLIHTEEKTQSQLLSQKNPKNGTEVVPKKLK